MGYIETRGSEIWIERTPSRKWGGGREYFEYILVIEAEETHEIVLDAERRSEVTDKLVQSAVDEWAEDHVMPIEDIKVYERKVIRASSQDDAETVSAE